MKKLSLLFCFICAMCAVASANEDSEVKLSPEMQTAEDEGCDFTVGFKEGEEWLMKLRFAEVKKLADEGNAQAAAMVADAYAYGSHWYLVEGSRKGKRDDVPYNLKEAFRYAKLSSEKGNESGRGILGQMHFFGLGTPTNYVEAINIFKTSTNKWGTITDTASYFLGRCYGEGLGVKRDLEKAKGYFNDTSESYTFGGRSSEWLWSHGIVPRGFDGFVKDLPDDYLKQYKPKTCTDADAETEAKSPAVRFLPGAKAVLMFRPEGGGYFGLKQEIKGAFKAEYGNGLEEFPEMLWGAISLLDSEIEYNYDYDSPDGYHGPEMNVKKFDLVFAFAFEKKQFPEFKQPDATQFKDGDLTGWDMKLWGKGMPPMAKLSYASTTNGIALFASNHETLRKARDFYQGNDKGSFEDLVKSGAVTSRVFIPKLGDLLTKSVSYDTLENGLAKIFFAHGAETLGNIGELSIKVSETKGGKMRIVATLEAGNENDLKRISTPLKVLIPAAAVGSQTEATKEDSFSPDKKALDIFSNLRLVIEGKTIKVETFTDAKAWKELIDQQL